jgi:hypothetical protein
MVTDPIYSIHKAKHRTSRLNNAGLRTSLRANSERILPHALIEFSRSGEGAHAKLGIA